MEKFKAGETVKCKLHGTVFKIGHFDYEPYWPETVYYADLMILRVLVKKLMYYYLLVIMIKCLTSAVFRNLCFVILSTSTILKNKI